MKTFALIAALAGLVAAAPAINTVTYPDGRVVTTYPKGLPKELVPKAIMPEGVEERDLEKRDNAGVYLCNDRNFSGYCVYINAPLYQCIPLGGDLNKQVSSVGPDKPRYCFFFATGNCQDANYGHFGTFSPGYPDLSAIGWNDAISSYYCNPS